MIENDLFIPNRWRSLNLSNGRKKPAQKDHKKLSGRHFFVALAGACSPFLPVVGDSQKLAKSPVETKGLLLPLQVMFLFLKTNEQINIHICIYIYTHVLT